MKQVDVTGADRTNCVPMVASIDREESWFARSAGAPRVLVCQLDRHLDCGRAVVRVEDFAQARLGFREAGSRLGQAD